MMESNSTLCRELPKLLEIGTTAGVLSGRLTARTHAILRAETSIMNEVELLPWFVIVHKECLGRTGALR